MADASATTFDITFRNVGKQYGDLVVLDDLTVDIPHGQKVAIIGASGSGKTTMLRTLMGLETLNTGKINIGDTTVADAERKYHQTARERTYIGMVFQHFNLFPHLTALDNVALALRHVAKMPRTEAAEQSQELLDRVGLALKSSHFPRQLSGGQQQRVGIARALALRPEIVLFDEVTSALDPELVGEVLQVIRDLANESNMTMLLVTHEMNFARHIADRVLFMDGGHIVEDAPPRQIFTQPESPRCQQFLQAVLNPIDWETTPDQGT